MLRFSHPSADGKTTLAAYRTETGQPRALLQISHGMCEYFLRYEGFAEYLSQNGILVFGHDHLGHGHSVASADELGFIAAKNGDELLVKDVHSLSLALKQEYPHLPLVLFGHSMGSFVARAAVARYPNDYDAAIICGTGGPDTPTGAGKLIASILTACFGAQHRSRLLRAIAFMGYNKKFEKGCDRNAWLTRDDAVVRHYNADPLCNYVFTLRAYYDLFSVIATVSDREWPRQLPKALPYLVVSGEMDPVGAWGKGVRRVADRMRDAGVNDLTLKLYPNMRHEILNEIEHKTVWSDILEWLEQKLPS